MDTFGKRMAALRKERKLTQDELAKLLSTSISVIGRYERDEMTPSIETAKKLADALDISLDYLVGEGELKVLDKKTLKRLEDIENLPDEDRTNIFYTLGNLIKAAKLKAI